MINSSIKKELNNMSPTYHQYLEAKRLIKENQLIVNAFDSNTDLLKKKFYVKMSSGFYSVGTFGGFSKDGRFMLKIEDVEPFYHIPGTHFVYTGLEDVYETKQEDMKQLHVGIE